VGDVVGGSRDRINQVAFFIERGYDGSTLREIADRLGNPTSAVLPLQEQGRIADQHPSGARGIPGPDHRRSHPPWPGLEHGDRH
jgi:hypothetical protein